MIQVPCSKMTFEREIIVKTLPNIVQPLTTIAQYLYSSHKIGMPASKTHQVLFSRREKSLKCILRYCT